MNLLKTETFFSFTGVAALPLYDSIISFSVNGVPGFTLPSCISFARCIHKSRSLLKSIIIKFASNVIIFLYLPSNVTIKSKGKLMKSTKNKLEGVNRKEHGFLCSHSGDVHLQLLLIINTKKNERYQKSSSDFK